MERNNELNAVPDDVRSSTYCAYSSPMGLSAGEVKSLLSEKTVESTVSISNQIVNYMDSSDPGIHSWMLDYVSKL